MTVDITYCITYGSCMTTTLLMGVILFLMRKSGTTDRRILQVRTFLSCIYFSVTVAIGISFSPFVRLESSLMWLLTMFGFQLIFSLFALHTLFYVERISLRKFMLIFVPFVFLVLGYWSVVGIRDASSAFRMNGEDEAVDWPIAIILSLLLLVCIVLVVLCGWIFWKGSGLHRRNRNAEIVLQIQVTKVGWLFLSFLLWGLFSFLSLWVVYPGVKVGFMLLTVAFFFILAVQVLLNPGYFFMLVSELSDVSESAFLRKEALLVLKRKVDNWMEDKGYLQTGIVVADVAGIVGVSPKKLSLYISSTFGCNFNVWLNTLRVEEAKRIMEYNSDVSITELSEMVGFSDRSHFSRQFKSITGETAVSFQKRFKKAKSED